VKVDIDGRCRFTYLRIRSISTVDVDSPTWKYGRYRIDRQFQKKIGRNRPSMWIYTKKIGRPRFSEKSKKRTIDLWFHRWWEMVPDADPPRSHGPMCGEKRSQHLSKNRHLSTDLSTRSIGHGRYRRSKPIHWRENTVDIDGRCRFTYGELRSIVDRRLKIDIILWLASSTTLV